MSNGITALEKMGLLPQKEKIIEKQKDFSEVKGQEFAKRAIEVAAAGGHNVLIFGSPSTGKNMLAERVETILPNEEKPIIFKNILNLRKNDFRKIVSALESSERMIIMTIRPCPCGHFGHQQVECTCTPSEIHRYLQPLYLLSEGIDMFVETHPLRFAELTRHPSGTSSKEMRDRVLKARKNQEEISTELTPESEDLMRIAFEKLPLTARQYNSSLKISKTITRLAGDSVVHPTYIAEAIQYRSTWKRLME